MPLYQWQCPRGHGFEQRQDQFAKQGDKKLCPICGALAIRQPPKDTTFRLKDGGVCGWADDGYAGTNGGK